MDNATKEYLERFPNAAVLMEVQEKLEKFGLSVDPNRSCFKVSGEGKVTTWYYSKEVPTKGNKRIMDALYIAGIPYDVFKRHSKMTNRDYFIFKARIVWNL